MAADVKDNQWVLLIIAGVLLLLSGWMFFLLWRYWRLVNEGKEVPGTITAISFSRRIGSDRKHRVYKTTGDSNSYTMEYSFRVNGQVFEDSTSISRAEYYRYGGTMSVAEKAVSALGMGGHIPALASSNRIAVSHPISILYLEHDPSIHALKEHTSFLRRVGLALIAIVLGGGGVLLVKMGISALWGITW